nr:hypothetical protein [Cronobacter dublinensis]
MLHESYIGSRGARFSLAARKSAMPFIYGLFIWPAGGMTAVMRNASPWLTCGRVGPRTPVMACPTILLHETHEQRGEKRMSAKWRVRNTVDDDCGVAGERKQRGKEKALPEAELFGAC